LIDKNTLKRGLPNKLKQFLERSLSGTILEQKSLLWSNPDELWSNSDELWSNPDELWCL